MRGREGVGREKGEDRGGKEKDGKEKGGGCPKLCALHPWTHRGEEGRCTVHPAILKHPRSHQERGGGVFYAKLLLTIVKCSQCFNSYRASAYASSLY